MIQNLKQTINDTYGFITDESLIACSMKANANALKKQFPSPLVLRNFEYLVLRSYSNHMTTVPFCKCDLVT